MRYEKKMLILSGNGKGVVVIERSGAGVKFTLNAFSLVPSVLKAGIITPRTVIIRDLPPVSGSALSATFVTGDLELDKLHFALFDTEIVLYGAASERMWESNLFDILMRRDRMTSPTPMPLALSPSEDGEYTRLPPPEQKAAYLDESLPRDNFYTPFDYSRRLPEVDAFLDAPRALTGSMLDGLAPTVTPHAETAAVQSEPVQEVDGDAVEQEVNETIETETQSETELAETIETIDASVGSELTEPNDGLVTDDGQETVGAAESDEVPAQAPVEHVDTSDGQMSEAAATELVSEEPEPRRLPWELESRFLSSRGTRKSVRRAQKIEPVQSRDKVKKLREMLFFERSRDDIEKLFASAPKDEKLNKLLPDVVWVRVELNNGAVSVGRGGDSFLCYAVGGTYAVNPFGEDAQWLPEVGSAPTERGYWLIFQSLNTGEIIRTEQG